MRGDALPTLKSTSSPSRENLSEILTVFRRKRVKPQSMATAKHKFQDLVFNPTIQALIDFLDELQKLAKDAFGVAAQAVKNNSYAKMPTHLKKSIIQAHLEIGTYEQIVSHLEWELELNGWEAGDEMQINNMTQQASKPNPKKPKTTYHHCKKPDHYRNHSRQLKKKRDQKDTKKIVPVTKIIVIKTAVKQTPTATTSIPSVMAMLTVQATGLTENQELSTHPVRPVAKRTTPQRNFYFGPNAANRPPPRKTTQMEQSQNQQQETQISSIKSVQAAAQALS